MKRGAIRTARRGLATGLATVFATALAALAFALPARADALDSLRSFVRDVKSGRATFTQTVTGPDASKQKTSSGSFEFARPDRFRFAYAKPFEQLIVGDGKQVWLYDADLNQVTVRPMDQALGATPAALLAGSGLDRDFTLEAQPDAQGVQWVQATPRQKDGTVQSLRIGFRDGMLAAVEILDGFGQRSLLRFTGLVANAEIAPQRFQFTPPPGADVVKP